MLLILELLVLLLSGFKLLITPTEMCITHQALLRLHIPQMVEPRYALTTQVLGIPMTIQ